MARLEVMIKGSSCIRTDDIFIARCHPAVVPLFEWGRVPLGNRVGAGREAHLVLRLNKASLVKVTNEVVELQRRSCIDGGASVEDIYINY